MKLQHIITIIFTLFVFASLPAYASYFPDPTPTAEWDLIGGQIFGGEFGLGSEVAAWDAGGTLRFRATIDTLANYYGLAAFYGPPTGSTDPHDFTWKIFDGSTLWDATVYDTGTTWLNYQGGTPGGTFILNLDRGDPLAVAPEPATVITIGLIAGSGLFAGIRKRKRKQK